MKKIIIVASLAMELMGCSVYKVISQPGAADLSGIGAGTRREEIITRLGAPKFGDTDKNGNKQDIFEFQSGFHQATKIRAIPYLAADVFTIGLAELILWPLEMTAMESATCIGVATYDQTMKVDSWSVTRKKDSSAQYC